MDLIKNGTKQPQRNEYLDFLRTCNYHFADELRNKLIVAIKDNNRVVMDAILSNPSFDPNIPDQHGNLPLSVAVHKGDLRLVIKLIVRYQLNVNGGSSHPCYNRPILQAVDDGNIKMVKLLLKYGASGWECDEHGSTALHRAIQKGHSKIATILLEHEEDLVNAEDNDRNTPLHIAAMYEDHKTIPALLKHGSNPLRPNGFNKTVIEIAPGCFRIP